MDDFWKAGECWIDGVKNVLMGRRIMDGERESVPGIGMGVE